MKYRYRAVEPFWTHFYRLNDAQKEATRKAWSIFKENPFDPRLRPHKIHKLSALYGRTIYAADIEGDLRSTFYIDGDWIVSVDIGGYTRATLIMDELENRGIVGPGKGAEPRDILIDLNARDYTPPVEQVAIIQPHLVICACEHCGENIEFNANELGDWQSVSIPCPHCGIETILSPVRG